MAQIMGLNAGELFICQTNMLVAVLFRLLP
jgi:hypothetical protein